MSASLHLLNPGQDKTALAIALLRQVAENRPDSFPKVWALLASRRQELYFRERLAMLADGLHVHFNIEFFNFYSLNARILKLAGRPARRLSSLSRHRILAEMLKQMRDEAQLKVFQRIAETRGFVSVLARLIDELKQGSIDVEDFAGAARSQKDHELAAIYRRYQETLRQSELADVEGEGWLALATLREQPQIAEPVDMLLAHGYDQFTPVQADLLAQLSRAAGQTHITLTALPGMEASLMPSRSQVAQRRLQSAYQNLQLNLNERRHAKLATRRDPALNRLGQALFRDRIASPSGDVIKLIEMPDPAEEARAVMRAVKRLLLDGAEPDSILIVLRGWRQYADYFAWGREEYELPLLLQYERALGSEPVIAALIDLLELAPRFHRRDLLDILRSPYFDWDLDDGLVDLLDRASLEQRFLGGSPGDWLGLVRRAHQNSETKNEAQTVISAQQAQDLMRGLNALFAAIRPPEDGEPAAYVRWLEALLGTDTGQETDPANAGRSPNIIGKVHDIAAASPAIVDRDSGAIRKFRAILGDLLTSDDVLRAAMRKREPAGWAQFWSELKFALESRADGSVSLSRRRQVLVTTAAEARGLPHDHVFILGLAEGIFPAEIAQDPLYLDSERRQMQERGLDLATRAERIDDRGLFHELISLPRKSLTLSRPTFQAGRAWIESYLWRAVRSAVPDAPLARRSLGAVIEPDEAANSAELLLAVADKLNHREAEVAASALSARNWLESQRTWKHDWRRLQFNRAVEKRRLSNAPLDEFTGLITRPALLEEVALRLGDERVWSASQLNDFGYCPFRFFARRLLNLAGVEEPETGLDSLQYGSLHHKILEETYSRIRSRQLELDETNQAEALEILALVAEDLFERAPERYEFQANASWQEQSKLLLKRLEALVRLDFSPERRTIAGAPRTVHRLEKRIDEFRLALPGGLSPLRVTALIDRIDNEGGQLAVIDYKTGSARIDREDMELGRDFQMMIYLSALMSEFGEMGADEQVAGGMFWHLRNLTMSGSLLTENEDDMDLIERARAHIANHLRMARAGQFPVQPPKLEGGKCKRYCEFSRLCRIQATSLRKSLPAAPPS